jgi:hypothetical protein
MFRRWKNARAKDSANTPRRAPDRTVRTAEKLVHRTWALELARWRDRQEFALRIERENFGKAIDHLIAAQRDGDPAQISVARTGALQALDAVHAAMAARDHARRTMRKELRVLTWQPKRSLAAAEADGRPQPRPMVPIVSLQKRPGRHLRRLVRWRSANLGQP